MNDTGDTRELDDAAEEESARRYDAYPNLVAALETIAGTKVRHTPMRTVEQLREVARAALAEVQA